jgi:DNA-binding MarR family transcriptional regulator
MAAPKKEDKEKYQKAIRVKLLDIERSQLEKLVTESGHTISEVIRELIMNGLIIPRFSETDLQLILSLTGIARNLNQITHQVHLGNNLKIEGDLNILIQFITELKNTYRKGYHDRKD